MWKNRHTLLACFDVVVRAARRSRRSVCQTSVVRRFSWASVLLACHLCVVATSTARVSVLVLVGACVCVNRERRERENRYVHGGNKTKTKKKKKKKHTRKEKGAKERKDTRKGRRTVDARVGQGRSQTLNHLESWRNKEGRGRCGSLFGADKREKEGEENASLANSPSGRTCIGRRALPS